MPNAALLTLILIVAIALVFDFINGFHDTANAIATSVAPRVLAPGVHGFVMPRSWFIDLTKTWVG